MVTLDSVGSEVLLLYIVFVQGRSLLKGSMSDATHAQLHLRGTPDFLFHLSSSTQFQINIRKIKELLLGFERRALFHPPLDRPAATPAEPTGASSLLTSVPLRWDREGSEAQAFWRKGTNAPEHSAQSSRGCLICVFLALLSLKGCSIIACPQEDVCFGSRIDLIDGGIGEGSTLEPGASQLLLLASENIFLQVLLVCIKSIVFRE